MKFIFSKRFSIFGMALCSLLLASGCDVVAANTTGLDFLNTVFLGITAAGGLAILRNV